MTKRDKQSDIPAGDRPDEVKPQPDDEREPTAPSEIEIEQGDVDEPGGAPDEVQPLTQFPPD